MAVVTAKELTVLKCSHNNTNECRSRTNFDGHRYERKTTAGVLLLKIMKLSTVGTYTAQRSSDAHLDHEKAPLPRTRYPDLL